MRWQRYDRPHERPQPSTLTFPSMGRPPSDAPQRALTAAFALVCREGAAGLTLEAVAKEAGLSKGGLLHHFPTKDALVRALVERTARLWEAAVEAEADKDPQPVGRYIRAFMRALRDPAIAQLGRGLLAAVALNQALLDPLRESFLRCRARIAADGLDLPTAYNCVLVADSLWFASMFDLPLPPEDVLRELDERLVRATQP